MKLQHTLVAFAALAVLGCCEAAPSSKYHSPSSPALLAGGCGPGQQAPKTTIGASVQVDPAHCKEKAGESVGAQAEFTVLDCITGAEAHIEVVFPRQEWHSMKMRAIGVVDAGPGK